MDQLPPFGRSIGPVIGPTYGVYAPLIAQNASRIGSTNRSTFSYGPHPRQQLDIYPPSSPPPTTTAAASSPRPTPLLIFLHGGGFANGDKQNDVHPLFYRNLGHFFAESGRMETICLNYRLVKHGAKFPSGAEDIETALKWIANTYKGQHRDLYLLGNSAGGIHVVHWLFDPAFHDFRRRIIAGVETVKLSGAVVVGALFNFKSSSSPLRQNLSAYLGNDIDSVAPLQLLRQCKDTKEFSSDPWPRLLIMDCELDPEDILKSTPEFVQSLKAQASIMVNHINIKGHNHISPPLALGSSIPAEEEWGMQVISWINKT